MAKLLNGSVEEKESEREKKKEGSLTSIKILKLERESVRRPSLEAEKSPVGLFKLWYSLDSGTMFGTT